MFIKTKYIVIGIIGFIFVGALMGYTVNMSSKRVGGNLIATPGLQDPNAPVATFNNADFYNLDVTNNLAVDGIVSLSGTGVNTINNLFETGAVESISTTSATYTLSTSSVCNDTYIKFTPLGAITTVTMPATSTLISACFPSIGTVKRLSYESTATSTVIAAGAGETLGYTSSTTIANGKHGLLNFIRDGANTVDIYLTNIPN